MAVQGPRLMIKGAAALVVGCFFWTGAASVVQAQDEEAPTLLDKITISSYATRSPQPTFDVPALISQVETDAPGNALAGDVADLLEFTPGVEVDNGPRRNGQTISIRGFDDEAIIILMDGRRQNFESAHDGRFYVDPSLLKSIEVVKGASSAIYGGGGIGGVVAFETKDAADLLAPGQSVGALASFGYRNASAEYAPTLTGFGRYGGLDLLANFSFRDSGDIEQGNGNELDTDDRLLSGLFKAGYTLQDFHTFGFQAQVFNNDGQEPNNGAAASTPLSNIIVNKEVQDNQFSLRYAFDNPANRWLSPKLHLYYNDTEVEEEDVTGRLVGRVQTREMDTLGFTIDNQTRWAVSGMHGHTFSYGLEIYTDEQVGKSSATPDGKRSGVPDAEALALGLYLQDEVALHTPVGEVLFIPALRFDHYESDDEIGNAQNEHEVSPKVSLSYKPIENLMLFGSWSQAFRAPNMTELYPAGLHFPGGFPVEFVPLTRPEIGPDGRPVLGPDGNPIQVPVFKPDGSPALRPIAFAPDNRFVPNPDLKPETVTTIEVGAGLNFESVLAANDRFTVKGAWFTSEGDDFITPEVDVRAGTTKILNIPNADLTGWEAEGRYELALVTARLGLSYVKAENDDTGEYLLNNVPLTIVAGVEFRIDALNGVAGWRGRFAERNDRVGDNDVPTDGYGVHDLYFRWSPPRHWTSTGQGLDALTVDFGIENIADKAYTKRFASLLEEGRSFVTRVSYQW